MSEDEKKPEAEEAEKTQGEDKKPEEEKQEPQEKSGKWSTSAKVGAAVGSAAIAAALIYAGRHKMRKMDEFKSAKPKSGVRYENEPEDDDDESGE